MECRTGIVFYLLGSVMLSVSTAAVAQDWDIRDWGITDWDITPRLTIGETFTDNRDLDPPGEEEIDFVTRVSPGISARRQTGRLDFFLDYNMQNLLFARDGEFETNHQLLGRSTAELVKEHFFLDANASVRQVIISARERLPRDNISRTGNRTDAITYGLSPYWINDFAGYARAQARYRFDGVHVGEGASDSFRQSVTASLDSSRRFTILNWGLSYFYQQLSREGGEDSTRQSASGQASYRLTDDWTLLARGGYEDHDLATFTDTEDGTYWSLGASWTPSRFISATALYGPDDKEYSLRLSPTRRTSLSVTRLERDVGIDPGVDWRGTLTHRTRYSTWSADYFEEVTSVQEVLLTDEPFIIFEDAEGNEIIFDEQGNIISRDDLFTLRDAEFERKRFQVSVGYRRGHSQFRTRAFLESREFEIDADDERSYGLSAGWTWRFAPRTRLILDGEWDRSEFEDDRQDDLWELRVGLARTFTPDVNATLQYRYARQDSSEPEQDYRENRITLLMNMVF